MKKILMWSILFTCCSLVPAYGAYHHGGDTDSDIARDAYPAIVGTKLDSCALCHTGGEYEKKPDLFVSLGSCQWCHYSYGYDKSGDIQATLNDYGKAYNENGKNIQALETIEQADSDDDGFTNVEEIAALRYPGNPADDPTKIAAPYRIIDMDHLDALTAHTQIMLMNTHKSGDFYAEYTGVPVADLLDDTGLLSSASGITVYAPDGWAQYHPLDDDPDPLMYPVYGIYQEANYYYDTEADDANSEVGWCSYDSPALADLESGKPIYVENGLQMLLAYARDGEYLEQGILNDGNKLDGEGPFRVVPPQKLPGPPDQSVKSEDQDVIWPFDNDADHNAGFATRSATIIKVEPLPEGTTDIDTLEAGWDYVDEGKILIYGAIDPVETILSKTAAMKKELRETPMDDFSSRCAKRKMIKKIARLEKQLKRGNKRAASAKLSSLAAKVDGCENSGSPDYNDWLLDCERQLPVYWSFHEISVLLDIEE